MACSQHTPLFHGRHFPDDIIILAVRWYLRYSLSYRDLEEMLSERGVAVDHSTVWRWVDHYSPKLDESVRRHLHPRGVQWRMDETYIKVAGEWTYLYRAVDSQGASVEFYLSRTRDVRSAKLFLRKALSSAQQTLPEQIVSDGNPTYPIAVRAMQREGRLPKTCQLQCSHPANNVIEQDHRAVQCRVKAKQKFRSFGGASHTIAGYESMHMLRKGQVVGCQRGDGVAQMEFIHRVLKLAV